MLSRVKDYVTNSTLKTLYYSFIYPYLDYNIINWFSAWPTNLTFLEISNKKSVRTILSKNIREPSRPLFQQLDILPLTELIKYKQGIFMWKTDHNQHPPLNQSSYLRNNSPIFLRQNISKNILPSPRTLYAKTALHIFNNKTLEQQYTWKCKANYKLNCDNMTLHC